MMQEGVDHAYFHDYPSDGFSCEERRLDCASKNGPPFEWLEKIAFKQVAELSRGTREHRIEAVGLQYLLENSPKK
jgi:hypothetical protein